MNTMEVLTLLLVIFMALTYIDQHKKKLSIPPPKVGCLASSLNNYDTEGNRNWLPIIF